MLVGHVKIAAPVTPQAVVCLKHGEIEWNLAQNPSKSLVWAMLVFSTGYLILLEECRL